MSLIKLIHRIVNEYTFGCLRSELPKLREAYQETYSDYYWCGDSFYYGTQYAKAKRNLIETLKRLNMQKEISEIEENEPAWFRDHIE